MKSIKEFERKYLPKHYAEKYPEEKIGTGLTPKIIEQAKERLRKD